MPQAITSPIPSADLQTARVLAPARRSVAASKMRIDSVDLLRGLIMVIMMLDHTRDFVHRDAFSFDPTDVSRTFPVLFFTRWITHFCAPLFVFLAGTAVSFQEMRGRSKAQLSRFLVTRGLWLIALELVVLRPLLFFNFNYAQLLFFMQVIWVTGWSMMVLAAAIHLPWRWTVVVSLSVIGLHNLLDGVQVTTFNGPGTPVPGFWESIWYVVHRQGPIFPLGFPGPVVFVVYPLIPWPAVMLAGYAFGSLYGKEESHRRRALLLLGSAIVAGFVVIRLLNMYGDPVPWTMRFGAAKAAFVVPGAQQIPPVVALPDDDDRSGHSLPCVRRASHLQRTRAHVHYVRSGTVVLLSAAVDHVACPRDRRDMDGWQASRLSVQQRRFCRTAANGCGVRSPCRLRAVDSRRAPAVSAVRLVRGNKGQAPRLVA
jgi:uncharacterized membrane protein